MSVPIGCWSISLQDAKDGILTIAAIDLMLQLKLLDLFFAIQEQAESDHPDVSESDRASLAKRSY